MARVFVVRVSVDGRWSVCMFNAVFSLCAVMVLYRVFACVRNLFVYGPGTHEVGIFVEICAPLWTIYAAEYRVRKWQPGWDEQGVIPWETSGWVRSEAKTD